MYFFIDETHLIEACQCGLKIKETQTSTVSAAKLSNKIGKRGDQISHKIFGGQVAEVNSIPWQVGIKVFGQFPFCGGTIIGPTTILTAAHCVEKLVKSPTFVTVIIAEHDWTQFNDSESL